MHKIFFILTCLLWLIAACNPKKNQDTYTGKRPNILFILADDFGIMDSQSYARHFVDTDTAAMYYETPNINRLVHQGVAFSQAYANPLCSPTRASVLTGRYAATMGFTTAMPPRPTYYNQNLPVPKGFYAHDVLEHKDDIRIEQAWVNATSNSALPNGHPIDGGTDILTLPEALKDYQSAFIGKWHIGGFGAKGYQPEDYGFEALAWYDAGGSAYYDWREKWNEESKERFPDMPQEKWQIGNAGKQTGKPYLTDDLTSQALDFLDEHAKNGTKPFFLHFSHFAIHSPYQAPKSDIDYFENKKTRGWNHHDNPVYAAMIKAMDRSVGAILNKLEETGLADNTVVIFMSDNGGIEKTITPRGRETSNHPFKGGKATLNEGGIRVPLVFYWKGRLQEARWIDTPVDCSDLFPSILEIAGYDPDNTVMNTKLDGQSIWKLVKDGKQPGVVYTKNTHFWHYPFNVIYNSPYDGYPLTPHSAIREDNYKLIFDWHGRLRLYDIENDPYEENDLSSGYPELTERLFLKLLKWLENNVEKRYWPQKNPAYNSEKEVRDVPFEDLFSSPMVKAQNKAE